MLRSIKDAIAKLLVKNMPGLLYAWSKERLQKIRTLPGTNIAENVALGEGSAINVQGSFKKLTIGTAVSMRNFCNILMFPEATLIIGDTVFFNNYCSINCLGRIEIGSKTIFGEGVKLYDHNHKYHYEDNALVVEKDAYAIGFIKIGTNCWVGSNVTILNNVEIGDNVIIGANCLIYKSIPSNSVVKHKEELIITAGK